MIVIPAIRNLWKLHHVHTVAEKCVKIVFDNVNDVETYFALFAARTSNLILICIS